jgi:hypothetical protein
MTRNTRFPYPLGIEITSIPRISFDKRQEKQNAKERKERAETRAWSLSGLGYPPTVRLAMADSVQAALEARKIPFHDASSDDHCIEVSTKKLYTKNQLRNNFIRIRRVMADYGLRPHHPDMVCGGGHIHAGIPGSRFRHEVMRDVCNRYFLQWVFSQPDEEEACDNLVASIDYNDPDIKQYLAGEYAPTDDGIDNIPTKVKALFDPKDKDGCCSKSYSVLISDLKTVEFRFFEAPLDWSEQWDQVEFVLRYVAYLKRQYDSGTRIKVVPISFAQLQKITPEMAIIEFKKLLGILKLPYKRYAKYVNRNLRPRWRLKRERR